MVVFSSTDAKVLLPRNIADGMIQESRTLSTVAKLSGADPQRFGETEYIIFNEFPKAEFVEEGAQKSSSTAGYTSVKSSPKKAQVTVRFNEEVQWASEDYQLSILQDVATAGQTALARALDLGLYHRINPASGTTIAGWANYLTSTTKRVEIDAADADADLRAAVGLLLNQPTSWGVNGVAIDPKFAWALSNLQTKNSDGSPSGTQRYPQLGFGTDVTSILGINAAQGNTVSGTPEALDTKVRAIVGDFQNGIRWGVQRELPVELIRYGDPDGQGDLKGKNQIALRLELVYGWYVFADRFAVVEDAVAPI